MATVATRREKNLVQQKNHRTLLTPTGLLMEGHYAQNPVNERYGDLQERRSLRRIGSDVPDFNSHAAILARRKVNCLALGVDELSQFSIATDP